MLLPSWNKNTTTNPYASLCRKYPHMCKFLGTIPSDQLQYAKVPFWNNMQIPLSKHPWDLKIIIAIWNTKGSVCLNAHNKNWLSEIAREIPEAKWEIQNIHNHPYQTALSSGQHFNEFNKLPNKHPQAPEGPAKTSALISTDQPRNCNIDKAPHNSSSQNLTRKVKDWRDWMLRVYTSLEKRCITIWRLAVNQQAKIAVKAKVLNKMLKGIDLIVGMDCLRAMQANLKCGQAVCEVQVQGKSKKLRPIMMIMARRTGTCCRAL